IAEPVSGNPVYQDMGDSWQIRGKFVVSRAGEAYDARVTNPNRKFRLKSKKKRRISMKILLIRQLRFLVLATFLISILPARAQQSVVQLLDIYVTSDNY